MHLLTAGGLCKTKMLCFLLAFLQRYHHSLSILCPCLMGQLQINKPLAYLLMAELLFRFQLFQHKSSLPQPLNLLEPPPSAYCWRICSIQPLRLIRILIWISKMEVMTPPKESPDEGSIAIEFYIPPICSPLVRPGRPAEEVPFVSKQWLIWKNYPWSVEKLLGWPTWKYTV